MITSVAFSWEHAVAKPSGEDDRMAEIRERVRTWLLEDGYSVQDLPLPTGMRWVLVAHGEQGEYGIGASYDRPAIVAVTGLADLRNIFAGQLSKIDDSTIWRLRLGLVSQGLDTFSGLERPLGRISLGADVYHEGMTRNDFASALRRVRHGIIFLIFSVRQELGEPATPEQEAGPPPS